MKLADVVAGSLVRDGSRGLVEIHGIPDRQKQAFLVVLSFMNECD